MAYALLAGVSPVIGLYTAIVMAALGSLFGSSARLINGPTNAISLVVFGVVAGAGAGPDDPARIGLVALLALLAGLIQIALSLLKLAGLARHVPEAVVRGQGEVPRRAQWRHRRRRRGGQRRGRQLRALHPRPGGGTAPAAGRRPHQRAGRGPRR
jgi:hypothetical protein